jgi:hypothetical protein
MYTAGKTIAEVGDGEIVIDGVRVTVGEALGI